jgi:hypothetical protein
MQARQTMQTHIRNTLLTPASPPLPPARLLRHEGLLGLGGSGRRDLPAAVAGLRELSGRLEATAAALQRSGLTADGWAAAEAGLGPRPGHPQDVAAEARASFVLAALTSAPQLWRGGPEEGGDGGVEETSPATAVPTTTVTAAATPSSTPSTSSNSNSNGNTGSGSGSGSDASGAGEDLDPIALLRRAAAANSTEAQLALADRYLMGRGLEPSCREGLRHLKLAAARVAADVEKDSSNFHLPTAPVRLRERWSDAQAPQSDTAWDDTEEVVSMEEDAAYRGDATAQVGAGCMQCERLASLVCLVEGCSLGNETQHASRG